MDQRQQLPRQPYPGLRPYLDFEAPLLFGRDRQVGDIVDRLAAAQFVAVLGGSGSGKSSLVIAGVVPRLRSYGIPGAGDLWLPMVCTPGTQHRAGAAGTTTTPLTRLAHSFAALLVSRGSAEADATRVADISAVLRQELGLSRLFDAYALELAVAPGLDTADARVLIVLDQFEEVFHPSNRGLPDAQALVQCVLDHFFNPHPNCHLVLTMRSEFLNDCASYLELPDAINRSSYLVRRLGADELRAVITGPAQRFLRLQARSALPGDRRSALPGDARSTLPENTRSALPADARSLPRQVQFEATVVDRLLQDTTAIAHDPDHLPLLQHVLARLWEAALQREELDVQVPSEITDIDLVRAVNPGRAGDEQPLPATLNVLRAGVENWPEAIFQWHAAAGRAQLEKLLTRLAVKDANSGTYSRQRIDVDDAARLLGPSQTRADLRALIGDGFLGSVDYFFWDDSAPQRPTLQVSHESLIRGWTRFRRLVDAQSARQDQFVELLRNCQQWLHSDRPDDLLLESGELRRLREAQIDVLLGDVQAQPAATRLLAGQRDGPALAAAATDVQHYFALSELRQAKRALREKRARLTAQVLGLVTVFLVLVPAALFTWLVMNPTQSRVEQLFEAGKRAAGVPPQSVQSRPGEGEAALDTLLRAAQLVQQARGGLGSWAVQTSQFFFDHVDHLPPIRRQKEFLYGVQELSEPQVNSRLRELLTSGLWPAPAANTAGRQLESEAQDAICEIGSDARAAAADEKAGAWGTAAPVLRGRLYSAAASGPIGRAVFVPERGNSDRALSLYAAHRDSSSRRCTLGVVLVDIPAAKNASAVFDAGLRHFLSASEAVAGAQQATLVVQELHWNAGADLPAQDLKRHTTLTLSDPAAAAAVRRAAGDRRATVVPTWDGAARTMAVGDARWMLFSAQARRLDPPPNPLAPRLTAPRTDSPCARLAAALPNASGYRQTMLQAPGHCLLVRLPLPNLPVPIPRAVATFGAFHDVSVALFIEPSGATLADLALTPANPPAALAALNPFARMSESQLQTGEWRFDGDWLQHHQPAVGSQPAVLRAAPLSTCALARLAAQTLNRPGGC